MSMRLAVVDAKRCQPKKCSLECVKYCPKVRTGAEAIKVNDIATISEELCVGCGICVKKCPFKAISIVNLPERLEGKEVHRYGKNKLFTHLRRRSRHKSTYYLQPDCSV